jgi:hypothetical protein
MVDVERACVGRDTVAEICGSLIVKNGVDEIIRLFYNIQNAALGEGLTRTVVVPNGEVGAMCRSATEVCVRFVKIRLTSVRLVKAGPVSVDVTPMGLLSRMVFGTSELAMVMVAALRVDRQHTAPPIRARIAVASFATTYYLRI